MQIRLFTTLAVLLVLAALPATAAARSSVFPAPPVRGVVVDSASRPLPGVQIVVEGTRRATTTGADGSFVIAALAAGTYHLSASLIGYAPQHVEVTLPDAGPDVAVRIVLAPSPLALEGVIVTGSPSASNPLTVTHSTLQLSGRELDRNVGATVAQSLADQPGIATRYGGPAASTPVIRGLTGERVLMLENGQRSGDLSGTSADHSLTVDPLSATRMEVVRGPASLLYGSSALGGVVNVLQADIPAEVPQRLGGYAAAQGESASSGAAGTIQLTAPVTGSLALLVRGGARTAGDVRTGAGDLDNTSLENRHGDVGIGYIGETLTGGVAISGYGFEYGLPAPADAEESGVRIEGERRQAKARADFGLDSGIFRDVHLDGSGQWYTHDEIEDSGEVGTTFKLNTQTADARANTVIAGINGTIGASAFLRQYEPVGEEALTPPANSNSGGAFIYQELPIPGFGHGEDEHAPLLQLGLRYDHYQIALQDEAADAGELHFDAVSGSAGVNIPLSHESSAGVSVARAFRAPTVEELFSDGFHHATGSYERGNAALQEETNLGVEAIFRIQRGSVQSQASVYHNRISDYITPVLRGTQLVEDEHEGGTIEVPLVEYGQEDATLTGIEGQIEVLFARHWVVGAMGDLVRARLAGGAPIPFMPAPRVGGSVRYERSAVSVETELRHSFPQEDVADNEFATDPYSLLDASLTYSLSLGGRQHTITLRGDNLLDAEYREATSRIKDFAPNPGRNLSLVYRVHF